VRIALASDAWAPQTFRPHGGARPELAGLKRPIMACGVPVAAFPVPGPLDVVEPDVTGVLHTDLATAITSALRLDRRTCAQHAARCSWEEATAQFVAGLVPIPTALRARLAVSRSFAMIARKPARRQTSGAGESV
jgi:hypothetical protein